MKENYENDSNLYVAYGSNLNLSQMKKRCPTAYIISTGILVDWELLFRGNTEKIYSTIKRSPGSTIPVAVWSLEEADIQALDEYEEYPDLYSKQSILVEMKNGDRIYAIAYIMNFDCIGLPAQEYIDAIKEGYLDNQFDYQIIENALKKNENLRL